MGAPFPARCFHFLRWGKRHGLIMRFPAAVLSILLLVPAAGSGQNASLEIPQKMLNLLLGRLGHLSDAGVYEPAGAHVAWQWWITDAYFTLAEGSMTFTAAVDFRVGDQTNTETRTVPASVSLVERKRPVGRPLLGEVFGRQITEQLLRIDIGAFTVPIQLGGATITQADVAKLYSVSLPFVPRQLSVPLPDGGARTVTARVLSISPQYSSGKILLNFDIGF